MINYKRILLNTVVLLYSTIVPFLCTAGEYSITGWEGLQTNENALLIPLEKSPDMDNCEISKHGDSISRRDGQTRLFATTMTSYTVTSIGQVLNNNFDKLLISYGTRVEALTSAYSSTVIYASATVGYSWDFAQFQGNTYATNGIDHVFKTDGNTKTFIGSAPCGTSIVFFNNTCWIARTIADPGRIYYSQYGDPTNWVTGVGATDARSLTVANRGQYVVDLEVLGNMVLVLCSDSIMGFIGTENPYQVIEIDKSIGCKSKGSVVTYKGFTYFYGTNNQMNRTDGSEIEVISENMIDNELKDLLSSSYSAYQETISSQSDFETGITSRTSVSISPGNVVLSTGSYLADTAANWNTWTRVQTDTTTYPGSVVLGSGLSVSSHSYTTAIYAEALYSNRYGMAFTSRGTTLSTISLKFWRESGAADGQTIYVELRSDNATYPGAAVASQTTTTTGIVTSGFTERVFTFNQPISGRNTIYHVVVYMLTNTGGATYIVGGSVTSSRYPYLSHSHDGGSTWQRTGGFLDELMFYNTISYSYSDSVSGKITSPIIDTHLTNPVWGTIDWTNTCPSGTNINYYMRSSSVASMANNPTYVVQGTDGQHISGIRNFRYAQFYATMTTTDMSVTPQLDDVSLTWSTTGYYISDFTSLPNITGWGLFVASDSNKGSGASISYFTYSSSTLVTDAYLEKTATWVTQPNNSTIVVSSRTYIWSKALFSIDHGTQTPTVHSIQYNWTSGNPLALADMTSYVHDESIYFGCHMTGDSINNRIYVFSPLNNAWWRYKSGVYPGRLYEWKDKFIVASSSCNVVAEFLKGDTDLGAPINAYYYTKYISPKALNQVASFDVLGILYDRQSSGSLLLDYYLNSSAVAAGTISFPMTGNFPIKIYTVNLPSGTNGFVIQYKLYNQSGSDFTVHQMLGTTSEKAFKIQVQ